MIITDGNKTRDSCQAMFYACTETFIEEVGYIKHRNN